jgi:hypothetical protein
MTKQENQVIGLPQQVSLASKCIRPTTDASNKFGLNTQSLYLGIILVHGNYRSPIHGRQALIDI